MGFSNNTNRNEGDSRNRNATKRAINDLREMRSGLNSLGQQIRRMADSCRAALRAGPQEVLQFFSEVEQEVFADGYSLKSFLFLIFVVMSIIGVVGFDELRSLKLPQIMRRALGFGDKKD